MFGGEADQRQQLLHPRLAVGGRGAGEMHRLGDQGGDGHARIERAAGILEDELHAPAHGAQLFGAELGDLGVFEPDSAGGRLDQPRQQPAGRRLAAAALADQRERLAALDGEGHAVDRAHLARDLVAEKAAHDRVVLGEVVGADQHVTRRQAASWLSASRASGGD